MNLHKTVWTEGLMMKDFKQSNQENVDRLQKMVGLAENYTKRVTEENTLTKDELKTRYVGKLDPKKHLGDLGKITMEENIVNTLMEMVDKEVSFTGNTERSSDGNNCGPSYKRLQAVIEKMDTDEIL